MPRVKTDCDHPRKALAEAIGREVTDTEMEHFTRQCRNNGIKDGDRIIIIVINHQIGFGVLSEYPRCFICNNVEADRHL